MNATEMFDAMQCDILCTGRSRHVQDPTSPARSRLLEAEPGRTYVFDEYENVPKQRPVDRTWAWAYVTHFFAATERAGVLRKFNKDADRFLVGDRWPGAYGDIAMPQIERCIDMLCEDRDTRRAVVNMAGTEILDINRPSCWTSLHFLATAPGLLDMLVYQRSLHLHRLMPYDLILLHHIHMYVARNVGLSASKLRWTIGSLHTDPEPKQYTGSTDAVILALSPLNDPIACYKRLEDHPCSI